MSYAIRIKPLSVNEAWKGKRFKTNKYKAYWNELLWMLPKGVIVPDGKLCLKMVVGYSNSSADLDNAVKPFVDILQERYGFNDSRIYRMELNKVITQKGAEYIAFSLEELI